MFKAMFDLSAVIQRGKERKGAAQEASSLSSPLHKPARSRRQAEEEGQTGEASSGEYAEEEDGSAEEDGYGEEEDEEDVSAEGSSDQVSTVFCCTSHSVMYANSWGAICRSLVQLLTAQVQILAVLYASPPCPFCGGARSRAFNARHGLRSAILCHAPSGPLSTCLNWRTCYCPGPTNSYRIDATNQSWYTK